MEKNGVNFLMCKFHKKTTEKNIVKKKQQKNVKKLGKFKKKNL